jgi:PAS domain S-box-containing protein
MISSPIRVLCVDDEPDLCALSKEMLEAKWDMQVDTAHSVAEAKQTMVHSKYDAIVSDYQMPGMDGIEFVRSLREKGDRTPFILFTGKGREEVVIEGIDSGADSYMQKGGNTKVVFAELAHKIMTIVYRTRTEAAMREKADLHRLVFETLAEGLVVRDSEGKLILCNDEAAKMFDLSSADQLIARGISETDLVLEDGSPCSHEDLPTSITFRTGLPLSNALRGIKIGDEDVKWVSVNTRPHIIGGKVNAVVVSFIDVTSTLYAEKELQESERKFRLIAENMSDVIAVLGMDLRFSYVSPSCFKMRGFTSEEVMNQSLSEIFTPESMKVALGVFAEEKEADERPGFDPDRVRYIELEEYCKDGSTKWVGSAIRPIRDADGRPISLVISSRDVTESRASLLALHEVNDKLALLSHLTRHDIMNQLTVVGGWLEMMRLEDARNIGMREKALKALINTRSLIDFSAKYEGMGSITPGFMNIGGELETIARSVITDTIQIHNGLGSLWVLADPLLPKVLYNIVENAVRHGDGASQIRFHYELDVGCLRIMCEDDGKGVEMEDKERIFGRGIGKNTGEGLFFVRTILALTGLTIVEDGVPGEGARFVITVPEGHWHE